MEYICIETFFFRSAGFDALCTAVGAFSPAQRDLVIIQYVRWLEKWAADKELDSGLLFDVDELTLGSWSGAPQPRKFARGLVAAGVVKRMETTYPRKLLKGRKGFVVWGSLDRSWGGVHRYRKNKAELVPFLNDRNVRANWAAKLNIDPGTVPDRWFDADPSAEAAQMADEGNHAQQTVATAPPIGADGMSDPLDVARRAASGPPPPPSHREEEDKRTKDNGTGNNGKNPVQIDSDGRRSIPRRSGVPATPALYQTVRSCMYDRPLYACRCIDDSPDMRRLWECILYVEAETVRGVLARMTESPPVWQRITSPAAVLRSHCEARLRDLGVDWKTWRYDAAEPSRPSRPVGGGGGPEAARQDRQAVDGLRE